MATATLIDIGVSAQALDIAATNVTFISGSANIQTPVTLSVLNTYYQIASISLTPGLWCISAILMDANGNNSADITTAISLTSASGVNVAPIQSFIGGYNDFTTAVVKIATTTTIYINAAATISGAIGNGVGVFIVATQIQ